MEHNGHRLNNVVYARLDAIAAAEKVTRVELAALSRESLIYVMETHDIDLVNRLVGVLTPMNAKTAVLFFTHFLPWHVIKDEDGKHLRFGKMNKDKNKRTAKQEKDRAEFLGDESNTIWTWANANIVVEQKQVNTIDGVSKAVERALKGVDTDKSHADPVSPAEIIKAVLAAGVSIEDMLNACADEEQPAEPEKAEPVAEQDAA